jgi:hypothetical protein
MAGQWVIEDETPKGKWVIEDSPPTAIRAGGMINEIPRQIGLTARYGMEGLANVAQLVTEPIRYATDRITNRTGKTQPIGLLAAQFADKLGLPQPQGANERVIGDAVRLMAGTGGVVGAASAGARVASGAAQLAFQTAASNPVAQLSAAAGGGLAGGASREAGGSPLMQGGAAVLGAVAGGLVPGAASSVVNRINAMRANPMQLEGQISLALRENGVDFAAMPAAIRESLIADVRKATSAGDDLNPDALRRLADFRLTGLTPTRGGLTLDPVQITREQNLAKIGVNTADEGLQGLAQTQNRNNAQLVNNMDGLGAATGSADDAGRMVASTVKGKQALLRSDETTLWNAAKASPGYKHPISSGVISDMNRALGDEGLMPFMNPTISKYMEAFQTGQPFTPQDYRNLQSMLSREIAKGGNEGAAASVAARVLRDAQLEPMNGAAANAAIGQVNSARGATRAAYAYEDSTPLVRSVLSDSASSDPQRIAQRFVIGGTNDEAAMLAQEVGPQGVDAIKAALMAHLKEKATHGANNEVAKFSQSAFNKALRQVGDKKLNLFFSPEEITLLRANGRVASYTQFQPAGSAVNNSNSGALMAGKAYDAMNTLGRFAPLGKALLVDPLKSIEFSMGQRQAQNVIPSLINQTPRKFSQGLIGPALYSGGLLAAPSPVGP